MNLQYLIQSLQVQSITGNDICDIAGIHFDSRSVGLSFLFIAVRGTQSDGHHFIDQAIDKGAVAVVCEQLPEKIQGDMCYVQVKDSAHALGLIASAWYGNPSEKMMLVGVTGTNGKTTIATWLYRLFSQLGYSTGLISTVCNCILDKTIVATHTTPNPIEINQLLSEMLEKNCQYVFMEVSSHAIAQKRISGLSFQGGIFTNLTRDHLDYHLDFITYRDVKKSFFDHLPQNAFALTNRDDKNGLFVLQNTHARKFTYSLQTLADFKGKILETHMDGTNLLINNKEISTQTVGKFNVYNALAVYGAAILLDQDPDMVLLNISTLKSVSGRFQTYQSPAGYTAIVDYAHTPDALTNVLNTIHEVMDQNKRIITVVGCGGNRDKGKRPIMAKEAARLSNQLIITSDNPRFEEPEEIIQDMLAGLNPTEKKRTICIIDRREAIKTAGLLAEKGDVILIAGKGHEDYQEIKGKKNHFDDMEIVREMFES